MKSRFTVLHRTRFARVLGSFLCVAVLTSPALAQELTLHKRLTEIPGLPIGPFIRLGKGEIFTVDAKHGLLSKDEGRTWEKIPMFKNPDGFTISARALRRTDKGIVVVAFINTAERHWTWSNETGEAPGARLPTYVVRSLDEGRTWEPPKMLHEEWTGSVRDMIVTRDGKIVFTTMMMLSNPGRHSVLTYMSEDHGATWHRSNIIDLGGAGNHGGVTEATLEELRDGRLVKFIRTNWGQFWRAESKDSGRTWHPMGPSGIPASCTPGMLTRLKSGRLMLAWNQPYPEGQTSYRMVGGDNIWSSVPVSNHRSELSIAFSEDEGKTWSKPVIAARINTGGYRGSNNHMPRHEISYPYIFEAAPGEIWLTTWRGPLRAKLFENDFVNAAPSGRN